MRFLAAPSSSLYSPTALPRATRAASSCSLKMRTASSSLPVCPRSASATESMRALSLCEILKVIWIALDECEERDSCIRGATRSAANLPPRCSTNPPVRVRRLTHPSRYDRLCSTSNEAVISFALTRKAQRVRAKLMTASFEVEHSLSYLEGCVRRRTRTGGFVEQRGA